MYNPTKHTRLAAKIEKQIEQNADPRGKNDGKSTEQTHLYGIKMMGMGGYVSLGPNTYNKLPETKNT